MAKFVDRFDFNPLNLRDILKACAIFVIPMFLIVCQNETGSALVYLAFLLVMYREGMTGSVLLTGFCAILFFVLEIKFSPVSFGSQPFQVGTWLVLTIIQLIETLMIWKMSKNRSLSLTVLGVGLGGMLIGLSVSLSMVPFNVTWLQVGLIIVTSIYIVYILLLLLLLVTIFVAKDTKGSRSWLNLGPVMTLKVPGTM